MYLFLLNRQLEDILRVRAVKDACVIFLGTIRNLQNQKLSFFKGLKTYTC